MVARNSPQKFILYQIGIFERRIGFIQRYVDRINQQKNTHLARIDRIINTKFNPRIRENWINWRNSIEQVYNTRIQAYEQQKTNFQNEIAKLRAQLTFNPSPADPIDTTPTFPIDPVDPTIWQKQLAGITINVYTAMINYLKNNFSKNEEKTDFIVPPLPKNYNVRLNRLFGGVPTSETWIGCEYPDLGVDGQGYVNTYLEIHGYFSAYGATTQLGDTLLGTTTNLHSIASSTTYIPKKIMIPPVSIGGSMNLVNINWTPNITLNNLETSINNALSSSLNYSARQVILKTITALTSWARNTLFLVPPPFCRDPWLYFYGDPVFNPQQTPRVSNINMPNTLCPAVVDPVCDIVNDITYTNLCEAKKSGALRTIPGSCFNMVQAFDRTSLSDQQTPTAAYYSSGVPMLVPVGSVPSPYVTVTSTRIMLPSPILAEYFSRLYVFLDKNKNKVANTNQLASWAINYLQTYNVLPT